MNRWKRRRNRIRDVVKPTRPRPHVDFSTFFYRYAKPEQEALSYFNFLRFYPDSDGESIHCATEDVNSRKTIETNSPKISANVIADTDSSVNQSGLEAIHPTTNRGSHGNKRQRLSRSKTVENDPKTNRLQRSNTVAAPIRAKVRENSRAPADTPVILADVQVHETMNRTIDERSNSYTKLPPLSTIPERGKLPRSKSMKHSRQKPKQLPKQLSLDARVIPPKTYDWSPKEPKPLEYPDSDSSSNYSLDEELPRTRKCDTSRKGETELWVRNVPAAVPAIADDQKLRKVMEEEMYEALNRSLQMQADDVYGSDESIEQCWIRRKPKQVGAGETKL